MSRDEVHNRIDELLGLISINNNRLSLHTEKLSQLDIDVLRKNCIELYEQINLLALQGKRLSQLQSAPKPTPAAPIEEPKDEKPVVEETIVKEQPAAKQEAETKPKPDVAAEIEQPKTPQEEPKPKPKPTSKKTEPKPTKGYVPDEEMQSLFERFSSKPIESIAMALSVAKRYEFQSAFFDGDTNAFKGFLTELDGATDREGAFAVYHKFKMEYQWDNEELKDELKALMYRKYN
jgi:hypothetical protein